MNTSISYTKRTPYLWQWLGLISIFLLAGIIGHDPWKQDETYSFGIIYNFYQTHSWLVPTSAGVAFMEKPPLYYWTGVMFCKLFGWAMPLHDAARLASFFYMLLTTFFVWRTVQVLYKPHPEKRTFGWITIALMLGSLGLVRHSHDMFTDIALITGTAVAMYGMALLVIKQDGWKRGGIWLGIGIGVAFLSKGFVIPIILAVSAVALWMFTPRLQSRKIVITLLFALLAAGPFLFIWPWLLYQHSPDLFRRWFWDNNVGRFLGFTVAHLGADNKPFYFLYSVLWFAFPAFPLACIRLLHEGRNWRKPECLLPLSICLTGMAFLLASASGRALYLLPLLPSFALLGAPVLFNLSQRFLVVWNRFACVLSTLAIIAIWLTWWSLLHPADAQPIPAFSKLFAHYLPIGFVPAGSQVLAYVFALLLTLFYVIAIRLDKRYAVNSAFIWLAGVGILWGTAHTLLLPWIDETKSYRPVISSLNQFLAESPYSHDCVGNFHLGESIGPMFQYFGTSHEPAPLQTPENATCPLLLTSVERSIPENIPHWRMVWKSERPLDSKNEEERLYLHDQH